MAAFAVCQEPLSRQHSMLDSNRFDDDLGALDEPVGLARRVRAELAFDHHRKLDEVRYAHPTCGRGGEQRDEKRAPRLAIEDGHPRPFIEAHTRTTSPQSRTLPW